jgi:DNA-binding transcriptional LysR family regulator
MTLRHFQIFLTVCRRQSITAAAEELNMTQPAVSIAVRELESYYGVRLFDRMNRRIYLTEAGQRLYPYADAVLREFRGADEAMRAGAGAAVCSLGANVTLSETILPPALARLRREEPGLALRLFVGNTRAIEQKLRENEIDFALEDSPRLDSQCEQKLLCRETMGVFCAPALTDGRPLTLEQLAARPLLLREKGSGSRACVDAVLRTRGLAADPAAESISNLSLLRLAQAGLGFAVLPESLAALALEGGLLVRAGVADAVFERHYYLCRRRDKYLTEPLRRALDFLQREIPCMTGQSVLY